MRKDDRVRLQHMLDVANEALTFIQGRIRADLDNDRMLVLSLVRELENHRRGRQQSIRRHPFSKHFDSVARYYRHAQSIDLIHAYFDVDLDTVWNTVQGPSTI